MKNIQCERCKEYKPDVYERPDGYRMDVNNETDAVHTVCDNCDHENNMDI